MSEQDSSSNQQTNYSNNTNQSSTIQETNNNQQTQQYQEEVKQNVANDELNNEENNQPQKLTQNQSEIISIANETIIQSQPQNHQQEALQSQENQQQINVQTQENSQIQFQTYQPTTNILQNENQQNHAESQIQEKHIKVQTFKPFVPAELDEHDMIQQSAYERKKENYFILREWDNIRANFLNYHRGVLELIIGNLDQKANISQDFVTVLIKFFAGKGRQELNYARMPIVKPSVPLKQNNYNLSVYESYGEAINLIDEINLEHQKKVSEFSHIVEQIVTKDILLADSDKYSQQIDLMRKKLMTLQQQVTQLAIKAQGKQCKIQNIYQGTKSTKTINKESQTGFKPPQNSSQSLNLNNNNKNSKYSGKDLYRTQLGYLRITDQHKETQRSLAKNAIKFWLILADLEKNRTINIKKALEEYTNGFINCYGVYPKTEDLNKLLKIDCKVDEMFYPKNILEKKDYDFITKELNLEQGKELQITELVRFLENFKLDSFCNKMLTIKELYGARELSIDKFIDTKIIITVDSYLHCFDQKQGQQIISSEVFQKPDMSIKLNKVSLRKTEEGYIELQNNYQGLLMSILSQKEIYIFKFKNNDIIEEFNQVICSL